MSVWNKKETCIRDALSGYNLKKHTRMKKNVGESATSTGYHLDCRRPTYKWLPPTIPVTSPQSSQTHPVQPARLQTVHSDTWTLNARNWNQTTHKSKEIYFSLYHINRSLDKVRKNIEMRLIKYMLLYFWSKWDTPTMPN